jgi:hypothetical protein
LPPGDPDAFTVELTPDLPGAIDTVVLRVHPADLRQELLVVQRTSRKGSIPRGVVGGHLGLEHRADGLDPEETPVLGDEAGHLWWGRSSSRAKKALADFQDLVRAAQFEVLPAELLQLLALLGSKAVAQSVVDLGSADPAP